jgi:nitroreductase
MERTYENPWEVREADFPAGGQPAEVWRFLLKYAVLAPSGHNAQPWLFHVEGETVELRADRSRVLPMLDPGGRELTMSCGAALLHLRLAAARFGLAADVQPFPDSADADLLARVRLAGRRGPTEEERRLFNAITARRTHRLPFAEEEVPQRLLALIESAAGEEGAWLSLVPPGGARRVVAYLVARAERAQLKSEPFRAELAQWIRAGTGPGHDGMPPSAFGFATAADYVTPLVSFAVRTFDMGNCQAEVDRQLALEAPVLAVLGTAGDCPRDWLAAGQGLARVLLLARSEGLSAGFLNQPVEVGEFRTVLRRLLDTPGPPQLVLRIGYGKDQAAVPPPTPRRDVAAVLR